MQSFPIMKSIFLFVFTGIAATASIWAEETKRPLSVEETFFGSSPSAYALLRTETEAAGSDGLIRSRTWLDEYAKTPVLMAEVSQSDTEEDRVRYGSYQSKLTQSTLLLDVTGQGKGQPEPKTDEDHASVSVGVKNSDTTLAAMLLRYPTRNLIRWPPAQMKELDQNGFFHQFKTQTLVNGWLVRSRIWGMRQGDAEVKQALGPTSVSSVEEDGNCLYLTFHAANPKHEQTRIFCILPVATANARQLARCEPFCLLAGRFESKDEALQNAKSLRARLEAQKEFSDVALQVWNVSNTGYARAFYFVVIPHTADLIKQGRVAGLQKFIGTRLPLVPSGSFSVLVENLHK